ncbi:hypothetical protein RhiJN_00234 [Ceratobasidium sp. AG-Ba]|nr:hypothetical protein RhiJN_00234 [Ceratobasidium sp. AG-Ba]QRW01267.1 hypothetical protein RhiLY_00264 [Ceratobasidium sp. AG-Ba]
MALLTLLISIFLASILLSLPGFAPYMHGFVSIAKYPTYSYFIWRYAPSVLRRLRLAGGLAPRVNRLAQAYRYIRQILAPRSLLYAALSLSIWGFRTAATRSGLFAPFLAGLHILAGCWQKSIGFSSSVRSGVWHHFNPLVVRLSKLRERTLELWSHVLGHINRLLVEPYFQFASSFWSCALSHAMTCVVVYGFDITMPPGIWPIVSSYPLSCFVGVLTLIILWRLVCKALVLGVFGIDMVAYAYLIAVSSLARNFSPLRLAYWVAFALSVKHVFEMNDLPGQVARMTKYTILAFVIREDVLARQLRVLGCFLRKTSLWCAFLVVRIAMYMCVAALRLSLGLVFKRILVPAIRRLVFKIVCWTCMVCTMGCIAAATGAIEVFAALLVPVYYAGILVHHQYNPRNDTTGDIESPVLSFDPRDLSSISQEVWSAPPSPSSSSHSTASEGVRRLGRLINAYLDESGSGESVVELEREFENAPSMHAPPPAQIISPPTRFPLPTTPYLLSDINFEDPDEDEEVSALAARLSSLHIRPESSLAPRGLRCAPHRSTIMFAALSLSSHSGSLAPIRE